MKKKEKNNELELQKSPAENFSEEEEFQSYECYEDDIEEIQLDEEDFKNHRKSEEDDEDDVSEGKGKKKKKGKGLKSRKKENKAVPSEEVLYEHSVFSMVFGILSCSVFFGNPVFALLGMGFALSSKRNNHKSAFSNAGLFASLFGLALSVLVILIPITAFLFLVLLIVALGLLELLLILVVLVLVLIVNPMSNLLVQFLANLLMPATVSFAFII